MRRLTLALFLLATAASAFAADPLMVRVDTYQRVPQLVEGEMQDTQSPTHLIAAPEHGWPATFDQVRSLLSDRRHNRAGVMIIGITDLKPVPEAASTSFFIPVLGHAIEFQQQGTQVDIKFDDQAGTHVKVPAAPGTVIFGAPDEQIYLEVNLLPASKANNDTIVIMNGAKPLDIVSRVEPEYPKVAAFRNRSGSFISQLRIEKDGTVSDAVVLQPVNPEIDAAAVAAFKKWRFIPATYEGHPVTAYMVMMMPWQVD